MQRKVIGSPARLCLRALRSPVPEADVEFAVSFAEVVRRMEPPLAPLPLGGSPVLWVDQEFGITLLFAVLEIRDNAGQLAIVMVAPEINSPSHLDRNRQRDGSRRAGNAHNTRLTSRVEGNGCGECSH